MMKPFYCTVFSFNLYVFVVCCVKYYITPDKESLVAAEVVELHRPSKGQDWKILVPAASLSLATSAPNFWYQGPLSCVSNTYNINNTIFYN